LCGIFRLLTQLSKCNELCYRLQDGVAVHYQFIVAYL